MMNTMLCWKYLKSLQRKLTYPDPLEIEKMSEEPDKWIKFACYLYEKVRNPRTKWNSIAERI